MMIKLPGALRSLSKALLFCAFITPVASADFTVESPTQVSVSTSGSQPVGGSSLAPQAGTNGIVAFESAATNLVANDSNDVRDIFFRNPKTKQIERANISSAGVETDDDSRSPAASPVLSNGFYAIAFTSTASQLGSLSNPDRARNIYVRFPTLNITEIVSPALGFTISANDHFEPSITAVQTDSGQNKVYVVFSSSASDLVANDTNGYSDIYLATLTAPTSSSYNPATLTTITRISKSALPGQETDADSISPQISADGRYIVFVSGASNLVSPQLTNPNITPQIFLYDTKTGITTLVSKSKTGRIADGACYFPKISYNGGFIGYFSSATNIVGPGTSNPYYPYVIRYDVAHDVNEQVNLSEDGTKSGSGTLNSLGISADGRLVTFADASDSLVSDDTNGEADVFVKDMQTQKIVRLSVGPNGAQPNDYSSNPTLTAKSLTSRSYAASFESFATNLTSATTASGVGDVYATSFTIPAPVVSANTKLEVPPDVTLAKKTIGITAQSFSLTASTATFGSLNIAPATSKAVRYEFNITRTYTSGGKRRTQRTTIISKRNSISVSRARGTYIVKNRVRVINTKTKKTLVRTAFSPTQKLIITK